MVGVVGCFMGCGVCNEARENISISASHQGSFQGETRNY